MVRGHAQQFMVMNFQHLPPAGSRVCDYDLRNLSLYAAIIDADQAGMPWGQAAAKIMGLDIEDDVTFNLYQRHLSRALWIINDGLPDALAEFGKVRKA